MEKQRYAKPTEKRPRKITLVTCEKRTNKMNVAGGNFGEGEESISIQQRRTLEAKITEIRRLQKIRSLQQEKHSVIGKN